MVDVVSFSSVAPRSSGHEHLPLFAGTAHGSADSVVQCAVDCERSSGGALRSLAWSCAGAQKLKSVGIRFTEPKRVPIKWRSQMRVSVTMIGTRIIITS
jgi:hypothetical protein